MCIHGSGTTDAVRVLALGAFLKNRACVWDGPRGDGVAGAVQWSVMHDDLGDPQACAALERSVQQWIEQDGGRKPDALAHDLHPDFYSTRLAQDLALSLGIPAVGVQHHHAHVAAVVAAQGITGAVIGLALDGFGLGSDGQPWGGELLWVEGARWRRLAHLSCLPMPGGDRAAREPWRMALAWCEAAGQHGDALVRAVGDARYRLVRDMVRKGLNSPLTSSAGRWFDAMAALLGLCVEQQDEAQAAIALEAAASRWLQAHPHTAQARHDAWAQGGELNMHELVATALTYRREGAEPGEAAAIFHLGLADGLALHAARHAEQVQVHDVCLSGGCFFNRLLRERLELRLREAGLRSWVVGEAAHGDAHLAIGQAWVVAACLQDEHTTPAVVCTESMLCCEPLET
jgi:hydrogenase maturation protein HypF